MRGFIAAAAIALSFSNAQCCGSQEKTSLLDQKKGAWLHHVCQGAVRGMDAPNGGEGADLDLMECVDYVGGFSDGAAGTSLFCTGSASTGTIIREYVLFIQNHPKLLDEQRGLGFLLAMEKNFPCKASKKPD